MILVLVDTRTGRRRSVELGATPLVVGSGVDCDVVLPAEGVAERACRLMLTRGAPTIEVLVPGSSAANAVTVNDKATAQAILAPGDVVRIGPFQFVMAASERAVEAFANEAPKPPTTAKPAGDSQAGAAALRESARARKRREAKRSAGVLWGLLVLVAAGGIFWWTQRTPDSGSTSTSSTAGSGGPAETGAARTAGSTMTSGAAEGGSSGADPANPTGAGDPASLGANGGAPPTAADGTRPPAGSTGAKPTEDANSDAQVKETLASVEKLLADGFYSRGRYVLHWLKPKSKELEQKVAALRQRVDDAGARAAEEHLKFVTGLVDKGWLLPAIKNLDDEVIERFKGLEAWYRMLEKADEIEELIDQFAKASGAVPGKRPVTKRKHSVPRPDNLAQSPPPAVAAPDADVDGFGGGGAPAGAGASTSPPAAGAPSRPAPRPAAVARDPLVEAQRAVVDLRLPEAQALLEAMPPDAPGGLRETKRARLKQWTTAALGLMPARSDPKAPLEKEPTADVLKGLRLAQHDARGWMNIAWLALTLGDEIAFQDAVMQAARDPGFKDEVDSALAFARKLDAVPAGGFTAVDGKWLTEAERVLAASKSAFDSHLAAAAKVRDSDVEALTAKLVEAALTAPEAAAERLHQRCETIAAALETAAERAAITEIRARVESLVAARKSALEFIMDPAQYGAPEVGTVPEEVRAKRLAEVQKEAEKRISAIRALWGNESGGAPDPTVPLSDAYLTLVRETRVLDAALKAVGKTLPDRPELIASRLIPLKEPRLSVRNYALNVEERLRIDGDREVEARNQAVRDVKAPAELAFVWELCKYRQMLGLAQLPFESTLYYNARAMCEAQSKLKGAKDGDAPPPVVAVAKPKPTPGEDYLRGKYSERLALQAWCRSPDDHRNMLFPLHKAVACANVGNFWCVSFGVDAPK